MLGGGMRQAGIIAAAGIVALEEMTDRLAEDHANARRLAEGIARISGLRTDPTRVRTNILYIDLADRRFSDEEFLKRLAKEGSPPLATPDRPASGCHPPRHRPRGDRWAIEALRDVMQGCYDRGRLSVRRR